MTQVQFCQPFRDVQQLSQSSTGPLIQCGVTEVQFSTQGSTQGHRPSHCVSVSVHRNQGQQLEDDSLTGSEQENHNKQRLLRLIYGCQQILHRDYRVTYACGFQHSEYLYMCAGVSVLLVVIQGPPAALSPVNTPTPSVCSCVSGLGRVDRPGVSREGCSSRHNLDLF